MYWKRVLAVVAAEVIILALVIYESGLDDPSVSIGLIIYMPLVFGATIVSGLLALMFDRKLGWVLLASSPATPFILMMLSFLAVEMRISRLYHEYCFMYGGQEHSVTLDNVEHSTSARPSASILAETDPWSQTSVFLGVYEMREDVAYINETGTETDTVRYRLDMKRNVLYGFPTAGERISLNGC